MKTIQKAHWTPCSTKARLAMVRSGLTYSRIVAVLRERRIKATIANVRNVVAGITKRHDIREVVAELTGKSVEQLWPDAIFQEVA